MRGDAEPGTPAPPGNGQEAGGKPDALPDVLALPGTFCAPAVFDRLAGALRGRCRLRALSWMTDAGSWTIASLAEWVAGTIERDGGRPVVLIGHSTGGAIALRTAARHPELLRGLMLINTGPHMRGHGDVGALIDAIGREGVPSVTRRVLGRSFARPPAAADLERLSAYGHSVTAAAAVEVLASQRGTDLTSVLPEVRVPTAVVHGRLDPVRDTAEAARTAAGFPDATLHLVEAGHSPMYECPDAVLAVLEELLVRTAR
ncbi:alpha/beta hydrolase [Streptomyces tremellae]|uniref:alpha/beta fold hydrolase n=1 Tax=Streptomyces tremellae TaxID=1124239 RepID=UPI0031F11B07